MINPVNLPNLPPNLSLILLPNPRCQMIMQPLRIVRQVIEIVAMIDATRSFKGNAGTGTRGRSRQRDSSIRLNRRIEL